MKRIIVAFLATFGVMLALPASAFAAGGHTIVDGQFLKNGNPVKNATVTVVCTNSVTLVKYTKKTTTDNNGVYAVVFNAKKCPAGSNVTVKAKKGSLVGKGSGTVGTTGNAKINVAVVNVSVPELGWAAAIGATGVAGAGFLTLRRRQLGALRG